VPNCEVEALVASLGGWSQRSKLTISWSTTNCPYRLYHFWKWSWTVTVPHVANAEVLIERLVVSADRTSVGVCDQDRGPLMSRKAFTNAVSDRIGAFIRSDESRHAVA